LHLWNDQIAAHGQIVANHRLGSVADQTGSQQRQMALLVPGKVLVQVFAGQQLKKEAKIIIYHVIDDLLGFTCKTVSPRNSNRWLLPLNWGMERWKKSTFQAIQRQKVVWNVPSGERLGQQANVLELDANALFELGKQLQAGNNLDEVPIAVGVVSLQKNNQTIQVILYSYISQEPSGDVLLADSKYAEVWDPH
jgi:hypothetical protein